MCISLLSLSIIVIPYVPTPGYCGLAKCIRCIYSADGVPYLKTCAEASCAQPFHLFCSLIYLKCNESKLDATFKKATFAAAGWSTRDWYCDQHFHGYSETAIVAAVGGNAAVCKPAISAKEAAAMALDKELDAAITAQAEEHRVSSRTMPDGRVMTRLNNVWKQMDLDASVAAPVVATLGAIVAPGVAMLTTASSGALAPSAAVESADSSAQPADSQRGDISDDHPPAAPSSDASPTADDDACTTQCHHVTFASTDLDDKTNTRCTITVGVDAKLKVLVVGSSDGTVESAVTTVVQTNVYQGRSASSMVFCQDHRPVHSDAARAGVKSSTICGELCRERWMGRDFDTQCSERNCAELFHQACLQGSAVSVNGRVLYYCVAHLPANSELNRMNFVPLQSLIVPSNGAVYCTTAPVARCVRTNTAMLPADTCGVDGCSVHMHGECVAAVLSQSSSDDEPSASSLHLKYHPMSPDVDTVGANRMIVDGHLITGVLSASTVPTVPTVPILSSSEAADGSAEVGAGVSTRRAQAEAKLAEDTNTAIDASKAALMTATATIASTVDFRSSTPDEDDFKESSAANNGEKKPEPSTPTKKTSAKKSTPNSTPKSSTTSPQRKSSRNKTLVDAEATDDDDSAQKSPLRKKKRSASATDHKENTNDESNVDGEDAETSTKKSRAEKDTDVKSKSADDDEASDMKDVDESSDASMKDGDGDASADDSDVKMDDVSHLPGDDSPDEPVVDRDSHVAADGGVAVAGGTMIEVYDSFGGPSQMSVEDFNKNPQGYSKTKAPDLDEKAKKAHEFYAKSIANVKLPPSMTTDIEKKMTSVKIVTLTAKDQAEAIHRDVELIQNHLAKNALKDPDAITFDRAKFKSTRSDHSFNKHDDVPPETVFNTWIFLKKLTMSLSRFKIMDTPGHMVTDQDLSTAQQQYTTAKTADKAGLQIVMEDARDHLPDYHVLKYGAVHALIPYELMTTRFGELFAPILPMRWLRVEMDGSCGFHASMVATDLESTLKNGRAVVTGKPLTAAQKEEEFDAMLKLREESFDAVTEILTGKGSSDHIFALIASETIPSNPEDFRTDLTAFRKQCAVGGHEGYVNTIVIALTAALKKVSLTCLLPYATHLMTNKPYDEFASGIVMLQGRARASYMFANLQTATKGWKHDEPYEEFPRGHVVQVNRHFEALIEAPDMVELIHSVTLPPGWVFGILHAFEMSVTNTLFSQPFAVFDRSTESTAYFKSTNRLAPVADVKLHIVPGDTILYRDSQSKVRKGLVMMIILERVSDASSCTTMLAKFGCALDARRDALKSALARGESIEHPRWTTPDDIENGTVSAKKYLNGSFVRVLLAVLPYVYVAGADMKSVKEVDKKDPSSIITSINCECVLEVVDEFTPVYPHAQSVLDDRLHSNVDAHVVEYMKKRIKKSENQQSTFYSTPKRVKAMDELLTELYPGRSLPELNSEEHAVLYARAILAMSREGYDINPFMDARFLLGTAVFRPSDFGQNLSMFQHSEYDQLSSHIDFSITDKQTILAKYGHKVEVKNGDNHELGNVWYNMVIIGKDPKIPKSHSLLIKILKDDASDVTKMDKYDWSRMTSEDRATALREDKKPFMYQRIANADTEFLKLPATAPSASTAAAPSAETTADTTAETAAAAATTTAATAATSTAASTPVTKKRGAAGAAAATAAAATAAATAAAADDDDGDNDDDDDAVLVVTDRDGETPTDETPPWSNVEAWHDFSRGYENLACARVHQVQMIKLRSVKIQKIPFNEKDVAVNAFNCAKVLQNIVFPELAHMEPVAYISIGSAMMSKGRKENPYLYFGDPFTVYRGLIQSERFDKRRGSPFKPFIDTLLKLQLNGMSTVDEAIHYSVVLMSKVDPALYQVCALETSTCAACVHVCVCSRSCTHVYVVFVDCL